MNEDTALAIKTFCLAIIATVSGVGGYNVGQWDILLGMAFKLLGCVSTMFIIVINWNAFRDRIKKIFTKE